ncbi:MAG TPA: tRNA adenosine(34) deaminase TadA [Oligoflexia bacterium]|nr:tRNA adenosine(34) deaminase TadA [Oligoflexia bacterium]HMP49272.1 tRNA adenosine(34) deaminase TadA [Oligoflexia bacterium]
MNYNSVDEKYMKQALVLAEMGFEKGEVPIGAVLVDESSGSCISEAHNEIEERNFAGAHAEVLAIQRGSEIIKNWRLKSMTLYVTLEPCPMCTSLAVLSRVRKIVYGCKDLRLGACGSLLNLAEHTNLPHRIIIEGGVLEKECRDLIQSFFKLIREKNKFQGKENL